MDKKDVKDDSGAQLWHSESKTHAVAILRLLEAHESRKADEEKEWQNNGSR